jgi:hypothetical protein
MPHRHRYHIIALAVLGLGLLVAAVAMFYWNHANLAVAQEPELPDADGQAVVDYILTGNPYQEWGSWTPDRWTDFGAYIQSGEPHGNTVRIFVNDIAQEAVLTEDFDGTLPPGSLIVKENFMGTPEEPGDLAAITAMYKVEDFNPDANDWFWVPKRMDRRFWIMCSRRMTIPHGRAGLPMTSTPRTSATFCRVASRTVRASAFL